MLTGVDIPYVSQMGEIGEFCRARKPFCFRSVAVPQTIFVIPTASHYDRVNQAGAGLFPNVLTWQRGLCNAILDSQYSLDVALGETFKKCLPVSCRGSLRMGNSPPTWLTLCRLCLSGGHLS